MAQERDLPTPTKARALPTGQTAIYRKLATASSIGKTLGAFGALIGIGMVLLSLPAARKPDLAVSWIDSLFLATSAVCVTGLTTVNVGESYTPFGQAVLLGLIQTGGFGMMMAGTLFLVMRGGGTSLKSEEYIRANLGRLRGARPIDVMAYAVALVVLVELLGTVALTYQLLNQREEISFDEAIWEAAFHSVSAFCNAGISLYPKGLEEWSGEPVNLLIMCGLVIAGGIGFLTLVNFRYYYFWRSDRRMRGNLTLQTRICLWMTAILLVWGTLFTWLSEWEATLRNSSWYQGLLWSFVHSVMTRTAGFNVVDVGQMEPVTLLGSLPMMFVGGAPGSMAGGVKITTLLLLGAVASAALRRRVDLNVGDRSLPHRQADAAVMIMILSGVVMMIGCGMLMQTELGHPAAQGAHGWLGIVFEAVSAFGTVGLSAGITPELTTGGKGIIIAMMFIGRLGPLCLAMHLMRPAAPGRVSYPEEDVAVG
ncbi:MAG: TrkH family potassium uptake protein [Limisphaerales bacterium]